MNTLLLYLVLKANTICGILYTLSILGIFILIVSCCAWSERFGESFYENELIKLELCIRNVSICTVLLILLSIFFPNTKQLATVIVVPKVYNSISSNKELNKIPNNLIRLANANLESKIREVGNE